MRRERSFDWVYDNREAFSGQGRAAISKAVAGGGRA